MANGSNISKWQRKSEKAYQNGGIIKMKSVSATSASIISAGVAAMAEMAKMKIS